jgi:3-dehydroquinate dehydratase / shikimate dehydrogenase
MIIKTKRLILRPWKGSDFELFAKLNSDSRVMEFFPSILSRKESDELANRFIFLMDEQGWGLWAVEVPNLAPFIGFIGLLRATFDTHFTPAIEIGWRLSYEHWGRGYATEGAKAVLKYAFETLKFDEIVSFTSELNHKSIAVMERIGMQHDPVDDFDHPKLPEDHRLRRHVLYRLKSDEWKRLIYNC